VLAIALHVLLLILLLRLAPPPPRDPETKSQPITVGLLPEPEVAPAAEKAVGKVKPASSGAAEATPLPRPKPVPAPPSTVDEPVLPPLKLWPGMEKFNLKNMPSAPAGARSAGSGDGGTDARAAAGGAGTGEGPGGQTLHPVMWQREPTHAEFVTYLPPGIRPSGWGVIACRTVENFRVDDCHELGQSPPGSGLSRAVRLASWQFRVRPPRVGGKPVIGAWVRIRIEFSEGVAR
jgi:protein TonB